MAQSRARLQVKEPSKAEAFGTLSRLGVVSGTNRLSKSIVASYLVNPMHTRNAPPSERPDFSRTMLCITPFSTMVKWVPFRLKVVCGAALVNCI